MSTLIAYMSRHGCTEKAANILSDNIDDETTLVDLDKMINVDFSLFDAVIIGGSIHAGKIQNKVKSFCIDNKSELLKKELGLYLCCFEDGEKAQKQFDSSFIQILRNKSKVIGIFGGEFDFNQMNYMERLIVKKIAKITRSVSRFNKGRVLEFASKFQN